MSRFPCILWSTEGNRYCCLEKALELASQRLWLHRFDPSRFELIKTSDALPEITLGDSSVDYIYSQGVLHHTSYPEAILKEFYRILKPNKSACIMVYNRESIWLHLYTAYDQMILKNAFPGISLEEAFARNTDGVDCPVARCYSAGEFIDLCQKAGFQADYAGGYLSRQELSFLKSLRDQAIGDERLNQVHGDFLRDLEYDDHGYPLYHGKYAGVGGVYHLFKPVYR